MADQVFQVQCGFFDSVNKDRLYTAEQMNRPYKRVISNGVFATPQGTPSTDLQVLSAGNGMKIIVKKGEGLFADKWFENPSDFTIIVPNNTGIVPRRDSVIVQVDTRTSGRIGAIVYREGTPATNPVPPNIGTVDNVIEYRIANIYVAAGATAINQDAIVDLRGSSECLWVTSLVQQVDTSTLYAQWQTAYQNYYDTETEAFNAFVDDASNQVAQWQDDASNQVAQWQDDASNQLAQWQTAYQNYYDTETEAFNAFMEGLTSQLTVNTNIITYESHYVSSVDNTTVIPINITNYNKNKDVLMVRINGFFVSETVDYTIDANGQNVTLTKDIDANNSVDFLVLQSVVIGDTETVLIETQKLNTAVSALNADSGWIDFILESGATAFDSTSTPAVRKFGNQVFIRGAIKNLDTANSTIATLPTIMRPAMNHQYAAIAFANNTIAANCVIEIKTTGQITLVAKSGTIPTNAMLPIATQFIIG